MRFVFAALALMGLTSCDSSVLDEAEAEQFAGQLGSPFDGADYGPDEAAKVAHGERLSKVLLCTGCHNPELTGLNWGELEPGGEWIWTSNLTRTVPQLSDEQLRSLLTTGVHPVRGDMYIMPSAIYQHVAPEDMDALIAYLRTLEPAGDNHPVPQFGPEQQAEMDAGNLVTSATQVAEHAASLPPDLGPSFERGRQIAMVTCAECHGAALQGTGDFAPDLDIAGVFTRDQLMQLLTTGQGLEGRELELMALMGSDHFSHFTQAERGAVVDYILARAEANTGP